MSTRALGLGRTLGEKSELDPGLRRGPETGTRQSQFVGQQTQRRLAVELQPMRTQPAALTLPRVLDPLRHRCRTLAPVFQR